MRALAELDAAYAHFAIEKPRDEPQTPKPESYAGQKLKTVYLDENVLMGAFRHRTGH